MQQTLDVRLIRKAFGGGKFVCDNQVNRTQPDTDMSRLRSCEQTTNGASPLLIRDFRNGAEVDFFISYEFRSKTLGLLMGAAFDKAFRRFAEAFEQRADKIYGVKSA